ncbi:MULTISPECIES: ornithine carbamoyltransferase [Halopseudomonas]|uniref:Ornithine carbamoyltransferase n=1 Tax=Halopseudomonas pertucinogena TaxID=86175 RepID=A0ABQ2CK98_9GAMM|nr:MULTISPECIES: ornithine carbamoyltransferase [Halopseudomonas]WGK63202.1 ornithine carbamoyltransferase [Halopseudomonas sp. SMJS2]GGI93517.1 ornithine carbamoyltransferase, catabolic [Halopseudomonas pertucinogena]
MAFNLNNRHFLTLRDFTPREIAFLLKLAADLKAAKYAGTEVPQLRGKEIALIFEKDSTRTRVGFEVAAFDQGAHVTYLGPSGSHIGHKESVKDTARVLGRVYDAIEYRGYGQSVVEELARYAGVPVYNGLTDEFHPTQVLADFLTMQEHAEKPLRDIAYVFIGDAANNMGDSLLIGGAKMGMDVRLCAPQSCWPSADIRQQAEQIASTTGARIMITDDIDSAVAGVDFVYTDVWVSMGEPEEKWAERIKLLLPYQVNAALMARTGNPYVRFMHCLPAFHNTETVIGKEIEQKFGIAAMEVTDEVFESPASIVFDQAENRMHTIKAVLVATLGG